MNDREKKFDEQFLYILLIILILFLSGINEETFASSITTIGGNSYSGAVDGVQAISRLTSPQALTQDTQGNIYVTNSNLVSKIDSQGNLTIIAGSTTAGFADGAGLDARFNAPKGIVFYNNALYIADTTNHRIRKIDLSTGVVSTVAGTGTAGSLEGSSTSAQFRSPEGIAIDSSGIIYVADTANNKIRKIALDGTVSTYAGSGTAGFLDGAALSARLRSPRQILFKNDELIVADRDNNRIRRIYNNAGTLTVATLAGTGTASSTNGSALTATFNLPVGLALDSAGNLYIADSGTHKIRKLDLSSNVSTIAGTGLAGYKDGSEINAAFNSPSGIYVDSIGNLLIADSTNHAIRSLNFTGTYSSPEVYTFSGINIAGNIDGNSSVARFNKPRDMVYDSQGNLFVVDTANSRIRKITPAGVVSTFAGSSTGYSDGNGTLAQFRTPVGIAIDASDNLYVGDTTNNRIRKITPSGMVSTFAGNGTAGSANGLGLLAQFRDPKGMVFDNAGNLYVADYTNHKIRKIDSLGNVITLAGISTGYVNGPTTVAKFANPSDIAIDSHGNLLIADYSNNAIRKISNINGTYLVSTVAGGLGAGYRDGLGIEAQFANPSSLVLDADDNIYVADRTNNRIRRIDAENGSVTTIAGTGLSGFLDSNRENASFNLPEYLLLDDSKLLIADTANDRIRVIDISDISAIGSDTNSNSDLTVATIAGLASTAGNRDGASSVSLYSSPYGMVTDASGNIYVADRANNLIRKIDANNVSSVFAGTTQAGALDGFRLNASFSSPSDLAFDSAGNLYVADYGNHLIRKIAQDGTVTTLAGDGTAGFADGLGTAAKFRNPIGLAIDASDNIYVSDYNNDRIRKIDNLGNVSNLAGSGTAGFVEGTASLARFNKPIGIKVTNDGTVYVADSNNQRIRKISNGIVSTFAGGGAATFADGTATQALFSTPAYLAMDADENLYLADNVNNRIRKITPSAVVTTLSGTGLQGFKDGDVNMAVFNRPRGITINENGDFLISEDAHRIRKIALKSATPTPSNPAPIFVSPTNPNNVPVIKLINSIPNNFKIKEGVNLKLKAFVYDVEEGFNIEQKTIWSSDIQGQLTTGASCDTSILNVGLHQITISVTDNAGLRAQYKFNLEVVSADQAGAGDVDLNGDGVVDDQDTNIINPEADNSTLVQIVMPSKQTHSRRSKNFKLRAVAIELDGNGDLLEDLTTNIIWESPDPSDPNGLREFLGSGKAVKLDKLSKGLHTIYARVGQSETSIQAKVTKNKIIINP